jgi:endoglucanase
VIARASLSSHVLGSQRNGVNHVSMNMVGFSAGGPVRGTDYPTYTDALLDWYQAKQIASVRLMFTWEAVQSVLGGPIPPAEPGYDDYWSDLTGVIARLLARDIYVILSPWQYNSRSRDTDIVYQDASITASQFQDFWGPFAAAINGVTAGDQRVSFDLINEPHTHAQSGNKAGDIGISLTDWFACAQAAITGIRIAGATNTIFVPGMAYTSASGFVANGSAAAWLTLSDPLENIAVTVHCYSGVGSSSATVLSDACVKTVAWARASGLKAHIGEIAIDAGANGRPAFGSSFALAQEQWANWHAFCVANSDVLVGWNWWANSAAGWWNEGDSCDPSGFHWGLTLDDGATQTVYMDLIEPTLSIVPIHRLRPTSHVITGY